MIELKCMCYENIVKFPYHSMKCVYQAEKCIKRPMFFRPTIQVISITFHQISWELGDINSWIWDVLTGCFHHIRYCVSNPPVPSLNDKDEMLCSLSVYTIHLRLYWYERLWMIIVSEIFHVTHMSNKYIFRILDDITPILFPSNHCPH